MYSLIFSPFSLLLYQNWSVFGYIEEYANLATRVDLLYRMNDVMNDLHFYAIANFKFSQLQTHMHLLSFLSSLHLFL